MKQIGFIFDMQYHETASLKLFADLGLKLDLNEFHHKTAGIEVLRYFLGNRFSDVELE